MKTNFFSYFIIRNHCFLSVLCFLFLFFVVSCKNSDSTDTDKNTNNAEISNNISHNAVLVFNSNGKTEYIKKDPTKVFRKTESGLEYRFIERNFDNPSPKIGDIIILSLKYYNEKDSLIFDSKTVDEYFRMRVSGLSHEGGCIEEAYMMMSKGDSAIFKIDAENFYKSTKRRIQTPEYIRKGEKLVFHIKIKNVLTSEDFVKEHSDIYEHQLQQEKSLIQRFLMSVDMEPKIYDSGLIHFTVREGDGKKINDGDFVKIDYIASFIDGGTFDSSLDRNETFEFKAGNNEVAKGLDEGIKNMRVGEYALLIIPFRLAYGDEKYGVIPPFSTLIFEIEVIDEK